MRRPLLCLSLLSSVLAAAGSGAAHAAVTPTPAAAVSVVATPLIFGGIPTGVSADGTVIAGVINGGGSPQPYSVIDRSTGSRTDLAAMQLLTRDGRHVVTTSAVSTIGGTSESLPPLPAATPDGIVDASADGQVVITSGITFGTGYTSSYVSSPGGTTAVDLNGPSTGTQANQGARDAAISADGRYASFVHLDAGVYEVYRRDLSDGSLVPVSRTATGAESAGQEAETRISDDGRFVAFVSGASDLVPDTATPKLRLYRHDVVTGRTVVVAELSTPGLFYSMSGDGSRFGYNARPNGVPVARIVDLVAGTDLPLVRQDTLNFAECSTDPLLSSDGTVVLFGACGGPIVDPPGAPTLNGVAGLATLPPVGDTVGYIGVTPSRLYDSRNGETDVVPNLGAGDVVTVTVGGRGGVPADASAAVLNVTATNALGAGFVTVWPCDQERPVASNLNYSAGQTIPNAVVAGLALDGTVCLYTHNAADLIVDVAGSFAATSSYGSAAPLRILDTRADENPLSAPTRPAGSVAVLDVVGLADLPDSTGAVTLNVTVTKAAGPGFVTVYPCDADLPTASNLNYTAGQTIPNAVITSVAADGTVCLYTSNAADLIVDVNGFFPAGSGFNGLTPARLLDSRDGQTDTVPNLAAGSVTTLQVAGRAGVPADATTAVLNVTVTNPTASGFVTVYPCDGDLPTASNLNYVAGQTIPNLVVSKLSAIGTVCLFTKAPADLIVDIAGHIGFPAL